MATVGVEEDPVVQAARILLNLRNRMLLQRPEWIPAAVEADVCWLPSGIWPKGKRNSNRVPSSVWAAALMAPQKQEPAASSGYGACSSSEEREAPPRWRERSSVGPVRDSAVYYSAPSGSGPSTSADLKAQSVESTVAKSSPASVGTPQKEAPMKASSPNTPLYFRTSGAGSGASSSGDDGTTPPPSKRKALGSASSSDEGCSTPDKRARVDAGAEHGEKQQAISEPKKTQTPDAEKKGVVKFEFEFEFDLNMPPCPEDDEDFDPCLV